MTNPSTFSVQTTPNTGAQITSPPNNEEGHAQTTHPVGKGGQQVSNPLSAKHASTKQSGDDVLATESTQRQRENIKLF